MDRISVLTSKIVWNKWRHDQQQLAHLEDRKRSDEEGYTIPKEWKDDSRISRQNRCITNSIGEILLVGKQRQDVNILIKKDVCWKEEDREEGKWIVRAKKNSISQSIPNQWWILEFILHKIWMALSLDARRSRRIWSGIIIEHERYMI